MCHRELDAVMLLRADLLVVLQIGILDDTERATVLLNNEHATLHRILTAFGHQVADSASWRVVPVALQQVVRFERPRHRRSIRDGLPILLGIRVLQRLEGVIRKAVDRGEAVSLRRNLDDGNVARGHFAELSGSRRVRGGARKLDILADDSRTRSRPQGRRIGPADR